MPAYGARLYAVAYSRLPCFGRLPFIGADLYDVLRPSIGAWLVLVHDPTVYLSRRKEVTLRTLITIGRRSIET